MAIRSALGAGSWRLLRQLLVESALLALCGGGLGLWLASRGVEWILAINPSGPNAIPRAQEIGLDWQVVIFTTTISMLTGLLFGLAPAVRASKLALSETLKDSNRGATGRPSQHRLRRCCPQWRCWPAGFQRGATKSRPDGRASVRIIGLFTLYMSSAANLRRARKREPEG
jgi:hypothetical protein